MNKKVTVLFAIIGVFIITCIVIVVYMNLSKQDLPDDSPTQPTPVPTFQGKAIRENVSYNTEAKRKTIDVIQNRQELSEQGRSTRQSIIGRLNNTSGIVHKTAKYRLEYIASPDVFMAEILTTDINQAKEEVQDYLNKEGINQNDICYLPLVFYLSAFTSQSVKDTNTEFNPMPLGC